MANFKIGDRVRLAWKRPSALSTTPVGSAGTVVCIGPWRKGDPLGDGLVAGADGDYCVRFDCELDWKIAFAGQLEPILPTPSAADILAMANLPERDCIAPVTLNAPEWPRWEAA